MEITGVDFWLPGNDPWGGKVKRVSKGWTRQTRFGLWAGCGQAHAPGAYPTVPSELVARQSHWKPSSGFGEAAPARLTVDLPDYR